MSNCEHIRLAHDLKPKAQVCEDCMKIGGRWVHLRLCLECGHAGCCDSSPNRHASKHFHASGHPIMRSIEPGEDWGWCFVDEVEFDLSRGVKHARVLDE